MVNIARKILIFFWVAQDIYTNQIKGSANLYQFFYFLGHPNTYGRGFKKNTFTLSSPHCLSTSRVHRRKLGGRTPPNLKGCISSTCLF